MAKIVVFNQKGGVGKTMTTLNLAALLARRGRTPLVIDLDPQGHLSAISGVTAAEGRQSLYAFYHNTIPLAQLVRESNTGRRSFLPTSIYPRSIRSSARGRRR
jgi:chromosome partitioning protein